MKIKEIIETIENKQMPEKYDEWLHHTHIDVRCALAEIDYKPEILVHDEDIIVKRIILEKHPEMLRNLLGKENEIEVVNGMLDQAVNIPKDILEEHIMDIVHYASTIPTYYLEAKLEAIEYEPSSIELTMSPKQLYEIDSPLWARGLPLRKVFDILTDAEYEWGYDDIPDEDYE